MYRMAGSRIINVIAVRSIRSRRDRRPARGGFVFELENLDYLERFLGPEPINNPDSTRPG
jgi:hypothetical protein